MKNDNTTNLAKANAVWDFVFSDDPSIRDTLNAILDGKPLIKTLSTFQSKRDEVSQILFSGLTDKIASLEQKISDTPSMKPEEHQIIQLQLYHILCFLTYTEPTQGTTIRLPTMVQDLEQGIKWETLTYTVQPTKLCGKDDDPYQAYHLIPDDKHPDASALLLFPGTAPLPWSKGAYLTYASDITPYRSVGGSIYAQSKDKLRELVNVSRRPIIAVGHSLGGAMCGMLARDNPKVSIRAFSPPFALSNTSRIAAILIHLLLIGAAATLLYFGAPILTSLAACALLAVTAPLIWSLGTYVWRNLFQRHSNAVSPTSSEPDNLPHHLLLTQKSDVVSFVGDQNYTNECVNMELRHKGKQKNVIRAHTQAFSHLPDAELETQDIRRKTSSFRRIIANAYWETLIKPFATIGLFIAFTLGYYWPRKSAHPTQPSKPFPANNSDGKTSQHKLASPSAVNLAPRAQASNHPRSRSAPTFGSPKGALSSSEHTKRTQKPQ